MFLTFSSASKQTQAKAFAELHPIFCRREIVLSRGYSSLPRRSFQAFFFFFFLFWENENKHTKMSHVCKLGSITNSVCGLSDITLHKSYWWLF